MPAPGAPTAQYISASGNAITINWLPPGDDGGEAITGYRIDRRSPSGSGGWTTIVADTGTTTTNYTDNGLLYATNYGYRIAAINIIGVGSYSSEISADTDADPNPGSSQGGSSSSGVVMGRWVTGERRRYKRMIAR